MAKWVVVVSGEQYEHERLYGAGELTAPDAAAEGLAPGDEALLVAGGDEPVVFGLGRVDRDGRLQYTVNLLDSPLPAGGLGRRTGRLDEESYRAVARRVAPAEAPAPRRTYLVSVDMPIEASSPGEAVRTFWNYV